MRLGLLGPLSLSIEGAVVEVPGTRRRAALALLALAGDHGVSADRLTAALWPDELPDNALPALYNHVSRLRSHLGPLGERIRRVGRGYALRLEQGELDVAEAHRLSRAGAAPGNDPERVAATARAALELWRGSALAEFRSFPELEAEAVALDELKLRLLDDLLDARLELGERDVVIAATSAARAAPLRERTALLLVRALAADGRTADAMAAAQEYRHRLADETGLDPGAALADLEQRVASGTLARAPGGLAAATAPARTVGRPGGPIVGRQHDREEVLRLLGAHGVVTLTGPGGVGKTTLALDVAADPTAAPVGPAGARGDAVVVELSAVDLPGRVCQAVASTLHLRTAGEVGPEDVAAALVGQPLLLVLDNCEHVVDACRDLVMTLRRHAPDVRVLATSRGTLHLPGEYVVRLQPLPVPRDPSDLAALRRQPCVRAFLEHARRLRPGFEFTDDEAPDLVEVLRQLDGLPLGIELAARQVAVMPLREVRDRLHRALDLATGRQDLQDGRQRTLRATIDSSYRLLADHERRLLRALAPFPGGVDVATVEALAVDDATGSAVDPVDVVHRLVDASLVVADPASGRFRLLFTVRAFLTDELRRNGELEQAEERFVERCLVVAREVGNLVMGPDEAAADGRLRAELDNFRAARDVAAAHGRDDARVAITLDLADAAIWRDLRELWAWALEIAADERVLARPERPALLGCAADAARLLGDLDEAERLAERALADAGAGLEPYRALSALGSVAHFRGDFETARRRWLDGAEQAPRWAAGMIASAALAASYGGDPVEARALLDRAAREVAASGSLSEAAFTAYVEGEMLAPTDPDAAVPHYLEAIEHASRAGTVFVVGVAGVALASARTRTGRFREAAADFGHLLSSWTRTGHNTQLWTTARNAAALLAATGRTRTAALVLLTAESQPGAARVSPAIARHSGRAYVPLSDLADEAQTERLREEAGRLGPAAVLQLVQTELATIAEGG